MRNSLWRVLVARVASGAVVVVLVVAVAWMALWVLRPNIISDGTPVLRQLTGYLGRVFLHFDLGLTSGQGAPQGGDGAPPSGTVTPVSARIRENLPADLALLTGGIVTGMVLGLGGGTLAALRPRSLVARLAEAVAFVAFAAPVYVVGLGLLLLFGAKNVAAVPLPVSIPVQYVEFGESPTGWLAALIVPWLVLGLPLAGLCFRVMSGLTVDALKAQYVQTARAKGMRHRAVVLRHAAPFGLLGTLTLVGAATNLTILNLALLEPVFGVPGVYRDLPRAAGSSSPDEVLGLTLVTAVLVVTLNLLVDLGLRAIDPLVRDAG